MFGRRRVATLVAEFLGAGVLTLVVLSVQRSTIGVPFFVAAATGLAFAMTLFVYGGVAGGFFNPALTIAMWTARRLSTLTSIVYIAVQLLGGWAAYGIYKYFTHNGFAAIGGHFTWHTFTAEAIGAGILGLGVAAAATLAVSRAAMSAYSGLAYMLGIVAVSTASLGLLNPAVALGVRGWEIGNWGTWGTYVLGPVVGALIGVNLHTLLLAEPELAAATTAPAVEPVTAASTATKRAARTTRAKKSTTRRSTSTRGRRSSR